MNHAELAPLIDEKLEKIDRLFAELSFDIQQLDHTKVEEMISKYIMVRNKLTLGRKSFETFETSAKAIQDVLNASLVQIGNDTGVESFKTPSGTAFRKIKKQALPEHFNEDGSIRLRALVEALSGEYGYNEVRLALVFVE